MQVRRALALATIVPLFLAGCGGGDPSDDPTPIMPDPTTSSATPSETATPEQESAEDFIRRWVDVHNEMWRTGDTREFLALGTDECEGCKSIAATADRIYGAGGTVRWDGWSIRTLTAVDSGQTDAFRFVVKSAPTRYRETESSPWKELSGGRLVEFIRLQQDGASWRVIESNETS